MLSPSAAQADALKAQEGWSDEAREFLKATMSLSVKTRGKTWNAIAEELWRYVLFSEFVFDLPVPLPEALKGVPNIPDNPRLAIQAGSVLCQTILEPLQATFGRVSIRSGYRSAHLNAIGADKRHNCTRNEKNHARHIWDRLDDDGCMGAMACVVLPWFTDRFEKGADWRSLAMWIHDHLNYSELIFYPKLCAFNIGWHQKPKRTIKSHVAPLGYMLAPGQWADT